MAGTREAMKMSAAQFGMFCLRTETQARLILWMIISPHVGWKPRVTMVVQVGWRADEADRAADEGFESVVDLQGKVRCKASCSVDHDAI